MKNIGWTCLVLVSSFSACNGSKSGSVNPTQALPDVMTSTKPFEKVAPVNVAFQLYKLQANSPVNVNFSPLSLKLAFSLIYPGASGESEKLMAQIFGFTATGMVPGQAEFQLAETVESKQQDSQQLVISNSVWSKEPKSIAPTFVAALKERHAEVFKLSLKELNTWVGEATHGKISKLFDKLDSTTQNVFINAIYFKARWLEPFDKKDTHLAAFQASPHLSLNLDTMHSKSKHLFFEDDSSQWIQLAYQDSDFVMDIGLPKKRFNLNKLEEKLNADYLAQIEAGLRSAVVLISLPKFKFAQRTSFKRLLTNAGYGDLFSPKNEDFNKISKNSDFRIGDVIQATAIAVDETGTEASATTAVMTVESGMAMGLTHEFKADQPFVFILKNKKTGEIYFLGRVTDPLKEG